MRSAMMWKFDAWEIGFNELGIGDCVIFEALRFLTVGVVQVFFGSVLGTLCFRTKAVRCL